MKQCMQEYLVKYQMWSVFLDVLAFCKLWNKNTKLGGCGTSSTHQALAPPLLSGIFSSSLSLQVWVEWVLPWSLPTSAAPLFFPSLPYSPQTALAVIQQLLEHTLKHEPFNLKSQVVRTGPVFFYALTQGSIVELSGVDPHADWFGPKCLPHHADWAHGLTPHSNHFNSLLSNRGAYE